VTAAYPLLENAALYDQAQVEEYLSTIFRHVDWEPGQLISLLGIGEKGTDREGVFRERQIIPPGFIGVAHAHLRRWAQWHAASFAVPAVLHASAQEKGDVKLEQIAALTAIILDLDSGDIPAKVAFVTARLGPPTMTIASGGVTDGGAAKVHLYWLLDEPSEEVDRVAALRKLLAAKVGGDQSFGRATQVIRVPGSVHAKNGVPSLCSILSRTKADYSLDDIAEIIETMQPMEGVGITDAPALPLTLVGGMDFTPKQDTAIAALHRDINEGGDDLTRWSEFSKVAGFNIAEARAGRLMPDAAMAAANGWMLEHMNPPWPQARFDQEFRALVNLDVKKHGPWPTSKVPAVIATEGAILPIKRFLDIKPALTNAWLVRDLLPIGGWTILYGSPGSGKSFLAIDLSLRIAAGLPVDGRRVQQGAVVYVAAEGLRGVDQRITAFRQRHQLDGAELPFIRVGSAVDLLDPTVDIRRLIRDIQSEVDGYLLTAPVLIIIDTLAATFGGGDENTSDMVRYVNNVAKLRDEFGATVMVVHHRPKDAQNDTPRGHGSLIGAADTILKVEGGKTRAVSITKQKDGEEGPAFRFTLASLCLGNDEEGERVMCATVEYVAAAAVATSSALSPRTTLALTAMRSATASSENFGIELNVWREEYEALDHGGIKPDSVRRAFDKARKELLAEEIVSVDEFDLWHMTRRADCATIEGGTMDFSPSLNP